MFHVSKPSTHAGAAIGSLVALALLIAIWVVGYTVLCPADLAPRIHVAEVRR